MQRNRKFCWLKAYLWEFMLVHWHKLYCKCLRYLTWDECKSTCIFAANITMILEGVDSLWKLFWLSHVSQSHCNTFLSMNFKYSLHVIVQQFPNSSCHLSFNPNHVGFLQYNFQNMIIILNKHDCVLRNSLLLWVDVAFSMYLPQFWALYWNFVKINKWIDFMWGTYSLKWILGIGIYTYM